MAPTVRDVVLAGAIAATVSGLPSTAWALATGADPLAATRAAGTLLPGRPRRPSVVGGAVAHVAIAALWTAAFGAIARHVRIGAAAGAVGGLAIAALDLGAVGRHYPAIAALPRVPQWADHLAFGAVLGGVLHRRTRASVGHNRR